MSRVNFLKPKSLVWLLVLELMHTPAIASEIQGYSSSPEIQRELIKRGVTLTPTSDQSPSQLPNRKVRDRFILQAGLIESLSRTDEMERDLLYLKAKHLSEKELITAYPKLKKESLLKFKKIILEGSKSKSKP